MWAIYALFTTPNFVYPVRGSNEEKMLYQQNENSMPQDMAYTRRLNLYRRKEKKKNKAPTI